MTGLEEERRAAADTLDRLDRELAAKREQLARYAAGVAWDELARVKLAGGVISSTSGFLREMQTLELEVRVLERAVRLQADVVARRQKLVAAEEFQSLDRQRERLAHWIASTCEELARRIEELDTVEREVRRRDPNAPAVKLDELVRLPRLRAA